MAGLIISVITNKGGTGNTTTVVSLGQALVRKGKKVLVLEPGLIQKGTKEGFNVLRKGLRNYALENYETSFEIDLFQRIKMLLAAEFFVDKCLSIVNRLKFIRNAVQILRSPQNKKTTIGKYIVELVKHTHLCNIVKVNQHITA